MLDSKLMKLLETLSDTDYVTSKTLAEKAGISNRTVQTRIRELRKEIEGNGAEIESKQRYGYLLTIQDQQKYQQWLEQQRQMVKELLPNSVEERFMFILTSLLTTPGYQKIEDISEKLCVSSKTLSSELKQVECVLNQYGLTLDRKPYYGIQIQGTEFSVRKCCMDYLMRPDSPLFETERQREEITEKIGQILLNEMLGQRVKFSEVAFQSIVSYLCVTWARNRDGHSAHAREESLRRIQEMAEYRIAERLIQQLHREGLDIQATPAETLYVAVYIAGRRIPGDEYQLQLTPLVSEDVNYLNAILLECLQKVYGLNYKDNLNVRISLYNHIAAFHIRMLYDIPQKNPILGEIKKNYPFAYTMAQRGMVEFAEYYGKEISEDEIGFFAIILEMALEFSKDTAQKKNIMLVSIAGKSGSEFLEFRFRNEFGEYIQELAVCSVYEFEHIDLKNIDYVFTTVPIQTSRNIPVYEIGMFFSSEKVFDVRKKLELGSLEFLKDYYRETLFFPHVAGSTRKEVIRELCRLMGEHYPLPEGFYESVLQRERMGDTDFGNHVAIPHPEECMLNENVVCVGVLDKPVLWSTNMVQLVIMAAIYDSTSAETQKFYQLTSALLADEKRIDRAIEQRSYPDFMRLFME